MAATANPALLSYRNPKSLFSSTTKRDSASPPSRTKISGGGGGGRPSATVKCANNPEQGEAGGGGSLKEVLAGMVDDRVEQLLNREENRVLLDDLEKASDRVEAAKRELAEIQRQESEAKQIRDYINQLESRTSQIAECQREISEARAMVEEAERSLDIDGVERLEANNIEVEIDRNEERLESVKAASVSALVGTLAGLPIYFSQATGSSQLILPSAITFFSCALFGVTFRYAIRRDLDNFQLKTGTAAAFGFVKGLATLDGGPPLEFETGSFFSHALSGAIYVSENLLVFIFAAVALDFCYKIRVLSPFPIRRSASETNRRFAGKGLHRCHKEHGRYIKPKWHRRFHFNYGKDETPEIRASILEWYELD
ncbi:uncharacterized protein LOC127812454 isoform X2 [Diospyros lotus]|uniref:uncharacterized protein LOC127812454 isoform X2 n=1 Tax=Diospyros lotus TaxID=55363 RepID=UPI00225C251B|nr:uncharacterized protein LOC127812454 isoform X2 [Diospyros lotus]